MLMAPIKTTPSQENYVEHIYRMLEKGPVFPSTLAKEIGVTRPSATKFVNALVKDGLVHHLPHRDIKLTEDGKRLGRAIIRRKQCLHKLLVEICGMTPDKAVSEIHRLEHFISDDVLARFEVLSDFAGSSKGWIKRLHHRMEKQVTLPSSSFGGFVAGASDIHSNSAKDQRIGPG